MSVKVVQFKKEIKPFKHKKMQARIKRKTILR